MLQGRQVAPRTPHAWTEVPGWHTIDESQHPAAQVIVLQPSGFTPPPPVPAAPWFSVPGGLLTESSLVSLTIHSDTPGGFLYVSVRNDASLHYIDMLWIESAPALSGPTLTLDIPSLGSRTGICAVAGRGLVNSSTVCQLYWYTNVGWCSGESALPENFPRPAKV